MLQKSEVSRVGVFKGEAVVVYCDPLKTPALDASGFPEGYKRWSKTEAILECTAGLSSLQAWIRFRFNAYNDW